MAAKPYEDFKALCRNENSAYRALKCVELALQTFVFASILEIYLSENYDDSYTEYIRQTLISYISRCENVILSSFTVMDQNFAHYHQRAFENAEDRQKYRTWIKKALMPYKKETDSPLRRMLDDSLNALASDQLCYITADGDVYVPETWNVQ